MPATEIDFHAVEEKHHTIHDRLQNWARWCNGTSSTAASPMFRLYQSSARVRGDCNAGTVAVDARDAARLAKAVAALPEGHRAAVNWCYVKPVSPRRACQAIGTTMSGLALLVRDGRQMLLNRGA